MEAREKWLFPAQNNFIGKTLMIVYRLYVFRNIPQEVFEVTDFILYVKVGYEHGFHEVFPLYEKLDPNASNITKP